MRELIACSTFALTVTLAIGRPRIGPRWQVGPAPAALAGVFCLFISGIVHPDDIRSAAEILWRPFITILSIMVTTAVAQRFGAIDCLAHLIVARRELSVQRLFLRVFVLSAATASLLNNDAAVLLVTPLVVTLVRSRYPAQPRVLLPFAFVVFMAAGVAPFVVSNPMNMIVASYAGLNFNEYATAMAPISLMGWILAFVLLRRLFASDLAAASDAAAVWETRSLSVTRMQWQMLALLLAVLGSYPIMASIDGSAIWVVSAAGGVVALFLGWQQGKVRPAEILAKGVAWEILFYLPAVFILAIGLRNVGFVDYLTSVYRDVGIGAIGAAAALGSAALNNHPMAMINMLALDAVPTAGHKEFLAVLIGGDLGPRLLPIGSLAGLLWLESCRRLGVEIPLRQFVWVGCVVTIPTLAASLAMLSFR